MGFTEVLTVIFIVLKVAGVIGWPWWLVLLPEIIGAAGYVALVLAAFWVSAEGERGDRHAE